MSASGSWPCAAAVASIAESISAPTSKATPLQYSQSISKITPPIDLTLEYGVDFIDDDELVEITPKSIRLRKRFLQEHERRRAERAAA